jgi:hypothetical protein
MLAGCVAVGYAASRLRGDGIHLEGDESPDNSQTPVSYTPVISAEATQPSTVPPYATTAESEQPASETTTLPATTAAPETTDLESMLPNPMAYSAAAGSVVCSGEVRKITITPDGGPELKQIETQANYEPWTGTPNPGQRNPLDEALFDEVLATKIDLPDGSYNVFVRLGCVGLER